jgi:hypothetical protein
MVEAEISSETLVHGNITQNIIIFKFIYCLLKNISVYLFIYILFQQVVSSTYAQYCT